MTSAAIRLSSDNGATYLAPGVALADGNALAYNASGSYSIKAKLDSLFGVDQLVWGIVSADDAHLGSLPAVTTNDDKSCSFSVTKAGGAWLLQALVNNGIDQATGAPDLRLLSSLAVKVRNSAGQQEIAIGETTEAGPQGYTKAFNDVGRALASAGGSGTSAVNIAGSGTRTLTADETAGTILSLLGALTGDRFVTLPNVPGWTRLVQNNTTEPFLLKVLGPSGGETYLAPGQSKQLTVDAAGLLAGESLRLFEAEIDVSLERGSTGSTDTVLLATPPHFHEQPPLLRTTADVVGGTSQVLIGKAAGGDEVMAATAPAALGGIAGYQTASLGSDVNEDGAYYSQDAGIRTLRNIVSGSAITAGSVRVRILGETL